MTVRGSTYLENETKKIEVIAGEKEPAIISFIPARQYDSAVLTIEMKGDLGHGNEFIDLYVNGVKAESLTTHNHNKTYQPVFKRDIATMTDHSSVITLEFKPTRHVNKLWAYAWAANITLSLSGFEALVDEVASVEMLSPTASTASQMLSGGQSLSLSVYNTGISQQQTMTTQFASSTLGIQALLSIGVGVGGALSEEIIGKSHS